MATAQTQAMMKKSMADRDRAMQAAKAASTRPPSGALTPRALMEKMAKDRPMSAPRPKPPSVAFDPVTGIPPKGKQPPTKPNVITDPGIAPTATTPGPRPDSMAPVGGIPEGYDG